MSNDESELPFLTDIERATYEWQMWVDDFGEMGQRRLKNASALVTRLGGVGGTAAYHLAAAGIGRLVLAHAGDIAPSDLNRQLLMTHAGLGKPRIESAARRLRELNPRLEVVAVGDNVGPDNADALVEQCDVVVACAPRFRERLALNHAAVKHNKPLVNCAMYELHGEISTVIPGKTACVACLHAVEPPTWNRRFPVFGAVAGMIGAMGAMEAIKLIARFGETLDGRMMMIDLRTMVTRTMTILRDPQCTTCGDSNRHE